eukprot:3477531-Rhodomonas_salina.2
MFGAYEPRGRAVTPKRRAECEAGPYSAPAGRRERRERASLRGNEERKGRGGLVVVQWVRRSMTVRGGTEETNVRGKPGRDHGRRKGGAAGRKRRGGGKRQEQKDFGRRVVMGQWVRRRRKEGAGRGGKLRWRWLSFVEERGDGEMGGRIGGGSAGRGVEGSRERRTAREGAEARSRGRTAEQKEQSERNRESLRRGPR